MVPGCGCPGCRGGGGMSSDVLIVWWCVGGSGVWRTVVWRAVPVVRGGQWRVEGGASGDRGDGGGCGGFASCGSGWSLLAFAVAKMGSVPIEGDRYLTGPGEAGVENVSRLPGRNSCHRQVFSSCGAWRVVATMVVVGSRRAVVDEERWWWWWWWWWWRWGK